MRLHRLPKHPAVGLVATQDDLLAYRVGSGHYRVGRASGVNPDGLVTCICLPGNMFVPAPQEGVYLINADVEQKALWEALMPPANRFASLDAVRDFVRQFFN